MIRWCIQQSRTFMDFLRSLYKECLSIRYPTRVEVFAHVAVVVIGASILAFLIIMPLDICIFATIRWLLLGK